MNDIVNEDAAKAIYDLMPYDGFGDKPKWVERGNSFKQEEARRYASAALSSRSAEAGKPVRWQRRTPGSAGGSWSISADGWVDVDVEDIGRYRARGNDIRALYAAPVADIEPVSVPDGERQPGFHWIKASDGWEPWKWTPKGWTHDFVASYYTDEEIGEIGPYIPFPLAAAPHPTKTEASPSPASEWTCSARKQSLPEPADCDWPVCGCDPYADKVIAALEDAGALSTTKTAQGDDAQEGTR